VTIFENLQKMSLLKPDKKKFTPQLLKWNKEKNKRQMPWKGEKDPYKIWLSEIILQQTRVEQGLNYYNRFIAAFPSIHDLANAKDERVFKLWEGLGYYTRCRNLLHTARFISKELKGKFPDNYDDIKNLKGIGPYTTAAISSFAFNLPYAVVDGNVFRVLARFFGISTATDTAEGKNKFTVLANVLLDKKLPGIYNQAIMDFGAVICKPAAPLCLSCALKNNCVAFLQNKVDKLPVKEKKISIKKRFFYYIIFEYKNKVAIQQRTAKDIWQQLFQFYLIETNKETGYKQLLNKAEKDGLLVKDEYEIKSVSPVIKQQLSHQLITGRFITPAVTKKPPATKGMKWVSKSSLKKYAFPQFINQQIQQISESYNPA
jgi:A/G-specific adenine glycosylase